MTRIGNNRRITLWMALMMLTFGTLIASLASYLLAEKKVERANAQRLRSLLLADELRHSSDSLSRMAQGYIATGNPAYAQRYQEMLDIQAGRKPQPEQGRPYWERMPGDPLPGESRGSQASLQDRIAEAGLGEQERLLLNQALLASTALVETEEEAMRLVGSDNPNAEEDRQRARDILLDEAYLRAKQALLRPLDDFAKLTGQNTDLEQAAFYAGMGRWAFVGLSLLWLSLLWRNYLSLRTLLGASPEAVRAEIERIGKGDLSPPALPVPAKPDSVIGWLNETRQHLQTLTEAREQSEAALEEHSHYLCINNRILQQIGENTPLTDILNELMLNIEKRHPDTCCSILLASEDGRALLHAAAPSMPSFWSQATARVPIAEGAGSCGTAAFRGERVIVEDIQEHPYWKGFRELAQWAGLGACWSQPFKNNQGKVLGTFAIYHRQPAIPSDQEIRLIEDYAKLVQLAVERARLAEALRHSEEMYRLIAENCNDVIWIVDLPALTFSYISPSIERLRGWTPMEILSQPLGALVGTEKAANFRSALRELAARLAAPECPSRHETFETELPHKDGHSIPAEVAATLLLDAAGRPCQILGISRDISDRKAAEEVIRHMAYYDRLTNLPNRRLMEDRLAQLVAQARRGQRRLALLYIDLDKFKPVNDQYGHETGDWLLQQVAQRMLAVLRASDTVARVGGDEFVVLLPDITSDIDALCVAEKIRAGLEVPFVTASGDTLHISSSVGVVLYPDHANTPRDLLRLGDEAMYRAKQSGRNAIEIFAPVAMESSTPTSPA